LHCNATSRPVIPPVDWKYQRTIQYRDEYICLAGRVVADDVSRYELLQSHALVIHDVSRNDSGIYYCIEDNAEGERNTVYLDVIAKGRVASSKCLTCSLLAQLTGSLFSSLAYVSIVFTFITD